MARTLPQLRAGLEPGAAERAVFAGLVVVDEPGDSLTDPARIRGHCPVQWLAKKRVRTPRAVLPGVGRRRAWSRLGQATGTWGPGTASSRVVCGMVRMNPWPNAAAGLSDPRGDRVRVSSTARMLAAAVKA